MSSSPPTPQRAADRGTVVRRNTYVRRPSAAKQNGPCQIVPEDQFISAPASPSPLSETRETSTVSSSHVGLSPVVSEILVQYRLRQDFVRAQGNLDRQLKRIVSRLTGIEKVTAADIDKYLETAEHSGREHLNRFIGLRDQARKIRGEYEKTLTKLAQRLPVYEAFVVPLTGFGAIGLAQIVGEAGAGLENYSKPCKLWRRFGLHVYNGRAFATWKSKGGLSAHEWTNAGYCPRRRSVMYSITDSLLKKKDNRYRALYLAQKEKERAKAVAAGLTVCPAASIPKESDPSLPRKVAKDGYMSLGHINARATRWIGKRLLNDLWRAWRDHGCSDIQTDSVPASATDSAGEAKSRLGESIEALMPPQQS